MTKAYTGGCQCGKVRYEAQADIGEVITCNCSRCRKVGSLLSAVAMSDFKLLSGEADMTEYQFNLRQGPWREGYGDDQCSLSRRRRRRGARGEEI
jgi:hypothetical protein